MGPPRTPEFPDIPLSSWGTTDKKRILLPPAPGVRTIHEGSFDQCSCKLLGFVSKAPTPTLWAVLKATPYTDAKPNSWPSFSVEITLNLPPNVATFVASGAEGKDVGCVDVKARLAKQSHLKKKRQTMPAPLQGAHKNIQWAVEWTTDKSTL